MNESMWDPAAEGDKLVSKAALGGKDRYMQGVAGANVELHLLLSYSVQLDSNTCLTITFFLEGR